MRGPVVIPDSTPRSRGELHGYTQAPLHYYSSVLSGREPHLIHSFSWFCLLFVFVFLIEALMYARDRPRHQGTPVNKNSCLREANAVVGRNSKHTSKFYSRLYG